MKKKQEVIGSDDLHWGRELEEKKLKLGPQQIKKKLGESEDEQRSQKKMEMENWILVLFLEIELGLIFLVSR